MTPSEEHIVVIGAGVIGLQTALSLLESGYKITIIAKHFPGDESIEYTSPWAGAMWRSHAPDDDSEQQKWDLETYNYWLSILARELNEPTTVEKSGLGIYESFSCSTSDEYPWFATDVLSFKPLPKGSLPKGMKQGHTYHSIMINCPQYLQYLLSKVQSLGGRTIRTSLPKSSSLLGTLKVAREVVVGHLTNTKSNQFKISAFVNATGLAAHHLVPDPAVFPIRGQTILVAGSANRITLIDGVPFSSDSSNPLIIYVLPRPNSNTSIIGGTKQPDDWTALPEARNTRDILQRAKEWAPELLNEKGDFEILEERVGLRPGRKGGARFEIERIENDLVCHAYGNGGAGYQNSYGCSKKVVNLLTVALQNGADVPPML